MARELLAPVFDAVAIGLLIVAVGATVGAMGSAIGLRRFLDA